MEVLHLRKTGSTRFQRTHLSPRATMATGATHIATAVSRAAQFAANGLRNNRVGQVKVGMDRSLPDAFHSFAQGHTWALQKQSGGCCEKCSLYTLKLARSTTRR